MCWRSAGHSTVLQLRETQSEQNSRLARSHANERAAPPKLGITGLAPAASGDHAEQPPEQLERDHTRDLAAVVDDVQRAAALRQQLRERVPDGGGALDGPRRRYARWARAA